MQKMPIRVVLADDHDIVRAGLRGLLERNSQVVVVGEASTGRQAIEMAIDLRPDVVIMDYAMPDLTGVEACQMIMERVPTSHVLFLSMHEEEGYFLQALRAGAAGYLVKRNAASEIYNAVLGTARGEVYLAPHLVRTLIQHTGTFGIPTSEKSPDRSDQMLDRLTPREREILQAVALGKTSAEIALLCDISIKTVQAHRAHIMEKLELRDIPHLVRFAIQYGVIPPEA